MYISTVQYVHIAINPSIALKKQNVQFVYTKIAEMHNKCTTNAPMCISCAFQYFFLETFSNIVMGNLTKY